MNLRVVTPIPTEIYLYNMSVPRFELVGAVSVVLVGGVGSCGRFPCCFELVGAVSVVLVGGVDRCGRLPPRWWQQLQSSSLAALAAAAVVVLLVSGGGSCSWCRGILLLVGGGGEFPYSIWRVVSTYKYNKT